MKIYRLEDMKEGWFIGGFEPSVYQTNQFEVSIKIHPAGEIWKPHYHKIAKEINVLVLGKMTLQKKILVSGDIFILEPGEIADPIFHIDCTIVCVKTPSVMNDKYIITNKD